MTDNQILHNLAALNPVSGEPDYDQDAERGLVALLATVRAEGATAPARARAVPGGRPARLPGWGAAISIAAALALAVVVAAGGVGARQTLARKPATLPANVPNDAHGLVADRVNAALAVGARLHRPRG